MGRYSLTPLVEAMRFSDGESVARALGISGESLTRYTVLGMEEATAERLACRAGFHPSLIWPELLDDAIADITAECEADDCAVTFIPPALGWGQKRRRFCSRNCQVRTNHRNRYRTNPEAAERKRAQSRAYKADVRALKARREARRAA